MELLTLVLWIVGRYVIIYLATTTHELGHLFMAWAANITVLRVEVGQFNSRLIWKGRVRGVPFHFYANPTVGAVEYLIGNTKAPDGSYFLDYTVIHDEKGRHIFADFPANRTKLRYDVTTLSDDEIVKLTAPGRLMNNLSRELRILSSVSGPFIAFAVCAALAWLVFSFSADTRSAFLLFLRPSWLLLPPGSSDLSTMSLTLLELLFLTAVREAVIELFNLIPVSSRDGQTVFEALKKRSLTFSEGARSAQSIQLERLRMKLVDLDWILNHFFLDVIWLRLFLACLWA